MTAPRLLSIPLRTGPRVVRGGFRPGMATGKVFHQSVHSMTGPASSTPVPSFSPADFRPLFSFPNPGGPGGPGGNGGPGGPGGNGGPGGPGGNGWSGGNDGGGGGGGDPLLGGGHQYRELDWLIDLLRNCLQGYGEGVGQYVLGSNVQTPLASTYSRQAASSICGQFAPSDDSRTAQSLAAVQHRTGQGGIGLSFVPIGQRAHYQARIIELFDRMMADEQFARFVREEHTKLAQRGAHRIAEE